MKRMEEAMLRSLIREHAPVPDEGMHPMVLSICTAGAIALLSKEEIVAGLRSIKFWHQPSTPYDDDEYWACKSPFDGRWYVFAAFFGSTWPTSPCEVSDLAPSWVAMTT